MNLSKKLAYLFPDTAGKDRPSLSLLGIKEGMLLLTIEGT